MAKLDIIIAPDPRLKLKCKPVTKVDARVARLMDDMLETMYAAPGIGLAAPQVGVTQRIIVLDVAREDEKPAPIKMANPELVWVSDEDVTYNEGCLSLPEHYADVARPKAIRVRYLDHQNEIRELEAEGGKFLLGLGRLQADGCQDRQAVGFRQLLHRAFRHPDDISFRPPRSWGAFWLR